jgi:hypothetical protein
VADDDRPCSTVADGVRRRWKYNIFKVSDLMSVRKHLEFLTSLFLLKYSISNIGYCWFINERSPINVKVTKYHFHLENKYYMKAKCQFISNICFLFLFLSQLKTLYHIYTRLHCKIQKSGNYSRYFTQVHLQWILKWRRLSKANQFSR